MIGPKTPLLRAHETAMQLLDLLDKGRRLACWLSDGMKALTPALVDVDIFRNKLKACYARAEEELLPTLPDFAGVHPWPIIVEGYTVSSAHEGVMKVAEWLFGQTTLTCNFFTEFYAEYYTKENGLDWNAVIDYGENKTDWLGAMTIFMSAEPRALLKMEYSQALRHLREGREKREVPELAKMEREILTALGDATMTGKELAAASGLKGSWLRTRLRRMVEKGVLVKGHPHGYRKALPLG